MKEIEPMDCEDLQRLSSWDRASHKTSGLQGIRFGQVCSAHKISMATYFSSKLIDAKFCENWEKEPQCLIVLINIGFNSDDDRLEKNFWNLDTAVGKNLELM
jgi:hypothetical protein